MVSRGGRVPIAGRGGKRLGKRLGGWGEGGETLSREQRRGERERESRYPDRGEEERHRERTATRERKM